MNDSRELRESQSYVAAPSKKPKNLELENMGSRMKNRDNGETRRGNSENLMHSSKVVTQNQKQDSKSRE